jgi:two-component system, LuxR family, response regulator FixJ
MPQRKLVLVVDDDESMRDAIHSLLDETGFANATYTSAEALLASGRIAEAFCLISDFRLPSMSGLDLLIELRRRRIQLPTIVITGHDAPGLAEEAAVCGAVAYFVKPFSGVALLTALRNLQSGSAHSASC